MQNKFDSATKKNKQLLFKSMITANNGDFSFEELPVGSPYVLKISNTGFKSLDVPVSFFEKGAPGNNSAMPSFDKDLGNIKLSSDIKDLGAIVVTSSSSAMKLSGDKKIFNVEKNIMSTGGTAVDVMRNVPSVNVDIDGNVTMRNSAPQLLVDGRPTTLTLDQIPADAIETVEVISNPSAKYDASGGGAGILNIVLKKNKKTGYNGNVRAGVDKRGALNGGFDFNVRQGKINFSASVNGNQNKSRTTGTTDRTSIGTDPQTIVAQNNYNKTIGGFIFGKVGVDYFATNRTTLSLAAIKVHGEFKPNETIDITTDSLYNNGKISTLSNRTTTGKREFNGQGLVFGFKQLFPKDGEELTVDANYFGGKHNSNSLYVTNYLSSGGAVVNSDLQKALGSGNTKNFVLQLIIHYHLVKQQNLKQGSGHRYVRT
ncbi:MAG: TonB-dependent receptor plug domain-containing protein [Ferruginibacter sp.]